MPLEAYVDSFQENSIWLLEHHTFTLKLRNTKLHMI